MSAHRSAGIVFSFDDPFASLYDDSWLNHFLQNSSNAYKEIWADWIVEHMLFRQLNSPVFVK